MKYMKTVTLFSGIGQQAMKDWDLNKKRYKVCESYSCSCLQCRRKIRICGDHGRENLGGNSRGQERGKELQKYPCKYLTKS